MTKRRSLNPGKLMASEMLPTAKSLAAITRGDQGARTLGNYAKLSPANPAGIGMESLLLPGTKPPRAK